jgi:hypothetical protein
VTRRAYQFRVRVIRQAEAYVDVEAADAASAEIEARSKTGVMSVFPGSAIRTDLGEPMIKAQAIEGVIGDGRERAY